MQCLALPVSNMSFFQGKITPVKMQQKVKVRQSLMPQIKENIEKVV